MNEIREASARYGPSGGKFDLLSVRTIEGDNLTRLDLIGEDAVLSWIAAGYSVGEIAKFCEMSDWGMQRYLHSTPDRSVRTRDAMLASGDAWLDRGRHVLHQSLDRAANMDASASRAYELACRSVAAFRNPAYRDRPEAPQDPNASGMSELGAAAVRLTVMAIAQSLGAIPLPAIDVTPRQVEAIESPRSKRAKR